MASSPATVRLAAALERTGAATLFALALAAHGSSAAEFVAPYVTSPREDVERLLELGDVGPGDYLVDLGSGDGRIVITAALRGAMGHGVELDPELVALAGRNARDAEVGDRVTFHRGDVFQADLSHASVVTLYLMPDANLRLRPKLLAELRPGSRVLSISFDMGEWQPDVHVNGRVSGGLWLWIVPARVAGRWALTVDGQSFALEIRQSYQQIEATLRRGRETLHLMEATLRGSRLSLLAGDGHHRYAFSGRVTGGRMEGLVQIHGVQGTRVGAWQARAVDPGP